MRPDYCPIGGEPCQSVCVTPCSVVKTEQDGAIFRAEMQKRMIEKAKEISSNARLIAAAPDLLEAAVDLVSRDFGYEGWDDACEQAALKLRAAVAKATGGSDE